MNRLLVAKNVGQVGNQAWPEIRASRACNGIAALLNELLEGVQENVIYFGFSGYFVEARDAGLGQEKAGLSLRLSLGIGGGWAAVWARARSCILDGEAVACGEDGIALFERIRYRRHDASVFMYAFDLIELNGDDLRREPLEVRKAELEQLLGRAGSGVSFTEHLEAEGPLVFEHACRLGLEGIVSKRKGSRYQSGRSRDWVKAKNPEAPAVTRLAEEDWARSWSSKQRQETSAGSRRSPKPRRCSNPWQDPGRGSHEHPDGDSR